jgi:hypothetical protein
MELVLDENGHVVLKDGLPVYKYEDGSESPFNAKKTLDNLNKKNAGLEEEKNRHFTKLKATEKSLEGYQGMDPKQVADALETVKNLKGQQILDANGIKALKSDMRESFEVELKQKETAWKTALDEKEGLLKIKARTILDQALTQEFANSEFFSGKNPKTIYPAKDAVKIFGHMFDVIGEGSEIKIIAKDKEGKLVMSQKNHGDPADFNEAMTRFIDEHPEKVRILNTQPGGPLAGGNLGPGKPGEFASPKDRIAAGLKATGKFDQ